ncbi:bifunctional glutamate/proline--tRNA ligase-like [Eriocheir sinensis]|uniref:bifunctional glutamate/proline--tRNA ligase-like n=1 Tax=Eriocheir sinensis TaxID=95602 RepID=UPI0021C5C668|nr:bifunctional glutamate/proline--tRNA ligase-like [Eriocheir sinensis]
MKVLASKTDPPLGAVLTCSRAGVPVEWGKETSLAITDSFSITSSHSISRHVARVNPSLDLYPSHILHRTEVDHWLSTASGPLSCGGDIVGTLDQLNKALAPSPVLVGQDITVADLEVFAALYKNGAWQGLVKSGGAPSHILRWYNYIQTQASEVLTGLPKDILKSLSASQVTQSSPERAAGATSRKPEEGGKFVELPGAKMGEVVVRFPPEASGYLHIGHAKAALLNQHYQQAFKGKLIMRFDDTNPAKEDAEFERVILEDLKLLQVKPDIFTHTSDHFDRMMQMCEQLLRQALAYCDDTDAETMKKEREERQESKNRNNPVEKNLSMWEEMKKGSDYGLTCCVRAKIDMKSDNGCMRDPTIYRCKNEPHVRTGTKYRVYPTYDFACPIVDSVEGVTHALRTTEYHDRDDQYFWFIEKLGLRSLHIYEYSRLNMNNTVLSKRKLTWFVAEGLVDGWDDPRFPTVRGVLRRGLTVEGLKDFIVAQGSSRSVVNMEWDKIWAFNKKVIDRTAPRFTALQGDFVPVMVSGVTEQATSAQRHPKDPSLGTKTVWVGPRVLVEAVDAELLREGQNATFINWGNIMIKKVHRRDGRVVSVDAEANTQDTDYKKTLKLTWLADSESSPRTPLVCVYFDHLINKSVLGKDEDFKTFIGHPTRAEVTMVGEPELRGAKAGDIIQLQRKGFFRVDEAYGLASLSSCRERPVVLFSIPDGHSKDAPTAATILKQMGMSPKEREQSAQGKRAEKSPQEESRPVVGAGAGAGAGHSLLEAIKVQGDKIRQLKADKADKNVVLAEVDILKKLKMNFQDTTGIEWKPDVVLPAAAAAAPPQQAVGGARTAATIHSDIKAQGDKVRELKAKKAEKDAVMAGVDTLKKLKKEFQDATGMEWKPDIVLPAPAAAAAAPALETPSTGSAADIHQNIKSQGDKVRQLKAAKADKEAVKKEVDALLALKKSFKEATGQEWKPDLDVSKLSASLASTSPASPPASAGKGSPALDLHQQIKTQGDAVRTLKANKADKDAIKQAVDALLALKGEFKAATGIDWKPDIDVSKLSGAPSASPAPASPAPASPAPGSPASAGKGSPALDLHQQIKTQGDAVRALKANKADKDAIKQAVDALLALKGEFKAATGIDWKPDIDVSKLSGAPSASPAPASPAPGSPASTGKGSLALDLHQQIKTQGDAVRTLKTNKADKDAIKQAVDSLLALKAQFKAATGIDWKPDIDVSQFSGAAAAAAAPVPSPAKAKSQRASPQKAAAPAKAKQEESGLKKQTRLGLEAKKEENLPDWYSQVITKSEMIEYYNVSGCYILRPWAFAVWDSIRTFMDARIKAMGVENSYFPLFVAREALEREKTHIADFSPEVAWVTKSGSSDMAEPVAIRPTSETVMYPAVAKWVQSHRDLPLRLNQWNNVVRWEFKQPTPFLRTREFLWQEGHTAFATKAEAEEEVYEVLKLYAEVYEELLAVPVVRGRKTEKEKFAGADFTTTTEAFISASGRAIQGATSHHLGQNFSKMFEIVFEDPESKEKRYVYQNSWGLTTRTIGVMVMVHGDNKGLVLPPRVASIQAVIMPVGITAKTTEGDKASLYQACQDLEKELQDSGVRARCDLKDNVTPAWKFNHWELKGVPLRLELGPREVASGQVFVVRRDSGEKQGVARAGVGASITAILETLHRDMFGRALADLKQHTISVQQWAAFTSGLDGGNVLLAPFCGREECEDAIKKDSAREEAAEPGAPAMGAKGLCIPFDQPGPVEGLACIHPACKVKPQYYTLFGRSY